MNAAARMLVLALCTSVATLAASTTAQAQATSPLTVGSRVRVADSTLRHCARVGRVVAISGGSVRVATPTPMTYVAGSPCARRREVTVHLDAVEISRGTTRHGRRGMLYGGAVGLLAGALRGATMSKGDPTPMEFLSFNRSETILILGGVGLTGGAMVGGIIGVIARTEHWAPASPSSRTTLQIVPGPRGGVGFRAVVPF